MPKVRNARRKAKNARGSVDKAQTALIMKNAKAISALESSIERKYNYEYGTQLGVKSLDSTDLTIGIKPVRIATTQGVSDIDGRVGDMVSVKSIMLKYNVEILNGASTPAEHINRVRVMMFWDNDPVKPNSSGSYVLDNPQWNQLLQTITTTSGDADPSVILSHYDHDKRNRFSFLYDKVHTLLPNDNATGSAPGFTGALGLGSRSATNSDGFVKSYKVGRKLRYTGGGTVPNNRKLYIAWISTVNTGFPQPEINYSLKVLYEDA